MTEADMNKIVLYQWKYTVTCIFTWCYVEAKVSKKTWIQRPKIDKLVSTLSYGPYHT